LIRWSEHHRLLFPVIRVWHTFYIDTRRPQVSTIEMLIESWFLHESLSLKLFKKLAPSLAEPLSLIYSAFMSVGRIPSAWTQAIVTPVFKRGNAANVGNCRPISLTSVACKLMERIISTDMLHYLRSQNVISKHQHCFLSGWSTNTWNAKWLDMSHKK